MSKTAEIRLKVDNDPTTWTKHLSAAQEVDDSHWSALLTASQQHDDDLPDGQYQLMNKHSWKNI